MNLYCLLHSLILCKRWKILLIPIVCHNFFKKNAGSKKQARSFDSDNGNSTKIQEPSRLEAVLRRENKGAERDCLALTEKVTMTDSLGIIFSNILTKEIFTTIDKNIRNDKKLLIFYWSTKHLFVQSYISINKIKDNI